MVHPGDERPHRAGPGPGWEESWSIEWSAAGGDSGGFVRLTLRPAQRTAWWWAYLVRRGQPLVAVREHEVPLPRSGSLEIRASGLWADLVCEDPLDHWSIGMEALAVALESPTDSYRGERGLPVPAGLDLEWEASELVAGRLGEVGYDQGGIVHGEVLIGDERIALDGIGSRSHDWGESRWWGVGAAAEGRASWRLQDGRWFHARLAEASAPGGVLDRAVSGDGTVFDPVLHAPVVVPETGGGVARVVRALCRARTDDGYSGWGWAEWVQPGPG